MRKRRKKVRRPLDPKLQRELDRLLLQGLLALVRLGLEQEKEKGGRGVSPAA